MATRFYLPADANAVADISPVFEAWAETGNADRRMMYTTKRTSEGGASKSTATTTAGNSTLCRQYVSQPLAAGNAFTTATTFKMQTLASESAINDNIINRVRAVKVTDDSGVTQAVLIALGNHSIVTELATAGTNTSWLTGQASAANYTTAMGDRLVFEIGHKDDGLGVSISSSLRLLGDAGTDLPEDETTTTAANRPWFETSLDLVFLATKNVPASLPFIPPGRSM